MHLYHPDAPDHVIECDQDRAPLYQSNGWLEIDPDPSRASEVPLDPQE